jgi:hypothetical protein
MPARQRIAPNNHLEEAMALLIRNQAAFVKQIARNDQERIKLQLIGEARQRNIEKWHRKSEARFIDIEKRLEKIEASLAELPRIILAAVLDQLPRAVKKEIGFKTRS